MPRKKKIEPAFDEETIKKTAQIKTKTLFDHLHQITEVQDNKYFDKITDADKKTFSNYMVNRFLSMNEDWTEIIADLDPHTTGRQLRSELTYKMYIDIFPKSHAFLKYIKGNTASKYTLELVQLIMNHYKVSKKEAVEYLHIFYSTENRLQKLKDIIFMYGIEEKEIKKMMKI
jgi:hypothetical protein